MMENELSAFGRNVYSQAGEDGIIEEVVRRLGDALPNRRYVDIGAHDGLYMSNTEYLRQHGWTGLCVDCNPVLYQRLSEHLRRWPGNDALLCEVSPANIAALTDWDVALCDIDVDGPEVQLWRAMPVSPSPAMMLMEIDALDALGVLREHSAAKRLSSFSSMAATGESLGYRMIAYTGLNCLFAKEALAQKVLSRVPPAEELYLDGPQRVRYRKAVVERSNAHG